MALRGMLLDAGYSAAGLAAAIGFSADAFLEDSFGIRSSGDGGRLSVLVDLFLLGIPIDRRLLAAALAPVTVADLEEMGLCVAFGERVRSAVALIPVGELMFASDRAAGNRRDAVARVSAAGITLSQLTVRTPVESALDLGTGCGLQALLSAAHSRQVTATDLNKRALRFAALNAALNDIDNVTFRQGNWFSPVHRQRFDLIVSNPPYVISPESTYLYRDSALPGDRISRKIVGDVPGHLTDNGVATVLCNWVHARDQPWSEPVAAWVRDSGCDALLLYHGTVEPLEYARRWNQTLGHRDRRAYVQAVERWLAYYREQGIEAIANGAVVLRRRRGANWVRALDADEAPTGPASGQIVRLFAAYDYLCADPRGDALLEQRFALVDGHVLDQTLTYRAGEYANQPATMRLLSGLGARAAIDPRAVHLLFACDGTTTLGEIVGRVAEQLGLEREPLAQLAATTFRKLLERGLIEHCGDVKRASG